ncbi:MAG: hypothetical protein EOS76_10995 [Mesorhizobium sp.]|nr:hypothetical protein EJ072_06150 [Mesorhizobium sp. M2A.F.Ca.ET.046.03.2.1]AZO71548.1 hypothetical protein EJ067_10530 [Mesorhizobium sp. M1D.F.Ca.ET.043.01.1.1]RVC82518.1 hypothetical protein EN766_00925 [Mesorhizobium sp. M2A.F.Ca.ET.046.02.1.1]RWB39374.1 MAG: hypothetical protein EOQ44_28140 [Mesorhizobium sp.]RWE19714.1 MAG: hypothetical protein EOS76_10995 [Mesorhizobium sp.]
MDFSLGLALTRPAQGMSRIWSPAQWRASRRRRKASPKIKFVHGAGSWSRVERVIASCRGQRMRAWPTRAVGLRRAHWMSKIKPLMSADPEEGVWPVRL